MIPLPEYAKIKDNYCIAYFGHNKEYIVQLRLLRPIMEKTFPGVVVFLCVRDEHLYLLKNEPRILSKTELPEKRTNFSYIREIFSTMSGHPVEQFMSESDMPCGPIFDERTNYPSNNCVFLTATNPPTRELNGLQIAKVLQYIKNQGISPAINEDIKNFEWVVSTENEQLYDAAASGKRVTLISTGFGENLFKMMFPKGEIFNPY